MSEPARPLHTPTEAHDLPDGESVLRPELTAAYLHWLETGDGADPVDQAERAFARGEGLSPWIG